MNKTKIVIFTFLSVINLISYAQATEQTCKDHQGYAGCKKECRAPICPLTKPICQKAYSKCKPKCFARHC